MQKTWNSPDRLFRARIQPKDNPDDYDPDDYNPDDYDSLENEGATVHHQLDTDRSVHKKESDVYPK